MKVFITHSAQDYELMARLQTELIDRGHMVSLGSSDGGALTEIQSADALIAVVSKNNPFVFYELGLALGAGMPLFVIGTPGQSLPGDVSAVPYVMASSENRTDVLAAANWLSQLPVRHHTVSTQFESIEAQLSGLLDDQNLLESLNPGLFEDLVMQLFETKGFGTVVKPAHSMPYDFELCVPALAHPILVEVKKLGRNRKVSVEAVQQLASALTYTGATRGFLVATSDLTRAAASLGTLSSVTFLRLEDVLAAQSLADLLARNTVLWCNEHFVVTDDYQGCNSQSVSLGIETTDQGTLRELVKRLEELLELASDAMDDQQIRTISGCIEEFRLASQFDKDNEFDKFLRDEDQNDPDVAPDRASDRLMEKITEIDDALIQGYEEAMKVVVALARLTSG